jgi:hypothetical protein
MNPRPATICLHTAATAGPVQKLNIFGAPPLLYASSATEVGLLDIKFPWHVQFSLHLYPSPTVVVRSLLSLSPWALHATQIASCGMQGAGGSLHALHHVWKQFVHYCKPKQVDASEGGEPMRSCTYHAALRGVASRSALCRCSGKAG